MKQQTKMLETIMWTFRETNTDARQITAPGEIYEEFRHLFDNQTQEMLYVFWLNTANKIIGYEMASKGSLNSSVVTPREIYRPAIVNGAASIIVGHNHPSGEVNPSAEDIRVTKQVAIAGKYIGIKCFDHIIFGKDVYYSFIEQSPDSLNTKE